MLKIYNELQIVFILIRIRVQVMQYSIMVLQLENIIQCEQIIFASKLQQLLQMVNTYLYDIMEQILTGQQMV